MQIPWHPANAHGGPGDGYAGMTAGPHPAAPGPTPGQPLAPHPEYGNWAEAGPVVAKSVGAASNPAQRSRFIVASFEGDRPGPGRRPAIRGPAVSTMRDK